jgi:hypothetical protein
MIAIPPSHSDGPDCRVRHRRYFAGHFNSARTFMYPCHVAVLQSPGSRFQRSRSVPKRQNFARLLYRRMWTDEFLVIWIHGASSIGQVIIIRWEPTSGCDQPIVL